MQSNAQAFVSYRLPPVLARGGNASRLRCTRRPRLAPPRCSSSRRPPATAPRPAAPPGQSSSSRMGPCVAERYPPSRAPFARTFHVILNHPFAEVASAALVLGTCLVFALQTLDLQGWPGAVLLAYERFVSGVFVSEYFLRWYAVGLNPRFLLTRGMLIDFCAVILPLGLGSWLHSSNDEFAGLFVRALRFARVFQLQRIMSDEEMKHIFGNVPQSRIRIANVILTVFNILYVSAGLFYDCEKDVNPAISNMFDCLYFSVISVFTVGFGDVVPMTSAGRAVAALSVLTGAVLIPVQLSEILSATMQGSAEVAAAQKKSLEIFDYTSSQDSDKRDFVSQATIEATSTAIARPASRDQRINAATQVDFSVECPQCRLRGHQLDARYCRNCARRLTIWNS